jgi:hypothetical protein
MASSPGLFLSAGTSRAMTEKEPPRVCPFYIGRSKALRVTGFCIAFGIQPPAAKLGRG